MNPIQLDLFLPSKSERIRDLRHEAGYLSEDLRGLWS